MTSGCRVAEPALLLVAAPLLLFPRGPLPWVGLGLLCLGWILHGFASDKWLIRTPLDLPVAVIFLMTIASIYPSVDLTLSLPKLYGIILGLFVYYGTVRNVSSRRRFWFGVGSLVASIVAISILGLVGTDWNTVKFEFLQRIYGVMPRLIGEVQTSVGPVAGFNPNELGGTLAFLLPLPLALTLRARLYLAQEGLLVAAVLFGFGVLGLSASRSALVSAAMAVLMLAVWRWRRAGLFLLGATIVALVLVLALDAQSVADSFMQLDPKGKTSATASLHSRLEIWERAGYMIEDFPFTGIGLNTFPVVLATLYPSLLSTPDDPIPHAHNIYLQTAVDLGLGGLLGFLGLWACAAHAGWRAYRNAGKVQFPLKAVPDEVFEQNVASSFSLRNRASANLDDSPCKRVATQEIGGDPAVQSAIVGMLAGMLSYLVFGLTDAITLGAKPTVLLWLMLGLVVASERFTGTTNAGGVDASNDLSKVQVGAVPRQSVWRRAASFALAIVLDSYWILAFLLVGLGYLVVGLSICGWVP